MNPTGPSPTPLCLGEACGRCLLACPGRRDRPLDARQGAVRAARLSVRLHLSDRHLESVVNATTAEEQLALLKSKESFMSWQSILRGVGVYSGLHALRGRLPGRADYEALQDAQDEIAERTPGEGGAAHPDGPGARGRGPRALLGSLGPLDRRAGREIK